MAVVTVDGRQVEVPDSVVDAWTLRLRLMLEREVVREYVKAKPEQVTGTKLRLVRLELKQNCDPAKRLALERLRKELEAST